MPRDPIATAQAQLDAYNAQDLDAFCACFTDDVIVADLNGATVLEGIAAYREKYRQTFATFPTNRVTLLGRMSVGDVVVDHERVHRSPHAAPFEVLAIFTTRGERICRVDFVKRS